MTKDQIKAYEEQLKPCPFCGGKARIENRFNWWWVGCSNGRNKCKVDCHTIQFDSPDKAVEVWNKRFEFEEWHGMNGVTYAPKGTFEKIFNDPDCGADMREPKDIIHKAIDNTIFAEEAYPNIKEELHKAVDMAEPKGEKGTE